MTRRPAHRQAPRRARGPDRTTSARPAAAPSSCADPAKYLAPRDRQSAPVPAGTIYTCPMHPEVRQVGPGSCPICGMALEPDARERRRRAEPRADRHDAPLLDRPRAQRCRCSCSRWAGISPALTSCIGQQTVELAAARARDAGGAVGRLAVLRARLAVARHAQSQHVHADRAWAPASPGSTASSRRSRPGSSRRRCAARRRGRGLFRGGRGHHRAGAARPGAGAARARADRRRHPRPARPRAEDRAAHRAPTAAEEEVPLDQVRGRRPAARAAGREDAGRRRGARRAQRASTSRW